MLFRVEFLFLNIQYSDPVLTLASLITPAAVYVYIVTMFYRLVVHYLRH